MVVSIAFTFGTHRRLVAVVERPVCVNVGSKLQGYSNCHIGSGDFGLRMLNPQ